MWNIPEKANKLIDRRYKKDEDNFIKQDESNISAKDIEEAIINANNKINEHNKFEMNKIVLWIKDVLLIVSIILVLLFAAFISAFGKPIWINIINGKIFELINIFLLSYVITGVLFIKHVIKICKEIKKNNDVSIITNMASLLLSIMALIIVVIALLEQVES